MKLVKTINIINEREKYSNLNKSIDHYKIGHILYILGFIVLFTIIIFLLYKNRNLNIYSKELENRLFNISNKYEKIKERKRIENYNKNDNFLQLYIENRTLFYIKGRQKVMNMIGSKYNDSNVETFQDKLNWLLVHESPELKANIVDKILLREYAKKKIGKDICVPIIKIYNDINEINLDDLPEKFVLKCNHGSGMSIICNNKINFNINSAKATLNKWMKRNFGLITNEYQYLNVKKKIFSETFLKDNLTDYL